MGRLRVDLPVNRFKQAILAGRPQIGLWCTLSSAYAAEAVAGAGFDWMLLDTEHSPSDVGVVLSQLQAASAYPVSAVVRPAWNDTVLIKRFLDIGAQTLLIPFVQNEDEAKAAAAAMRYPPRGVRGVSTMTRAGRFGRIPDYVRTADQELCLLVQVETQEALDRLEAIASVDGVDGVFIGPSDLAASMGYPGEPNNPAVRAAIDDAIARLKRLGKAPGILTADTAVARHCIEAGCVFTAVGIDASLLVRAADGLAREFLGPAGKA